MIDYDEIRKDLAISHNVLIAKDDPILIAATLHELIFQKYVDILLEKQMAHLKALETAQQKGIADAKVTAGRVITEGSNYAGDRVREAVKGAMVEEMVKIKKDLSDAWQGIQAAKRVVIAAAAVSCVCTIATVAVAITVI
jgi:hypothetical protein